MPIENVADLTPRVQYTASAAQDEFPYTFPIFQDADLVVDVDGVELAVGDDYTVSGAGEDTGGFVTLTTALEGGEIVTIYREIVIERTSDFPQNGPWFSEATNDELDRLTLIAQEQRQALRRAIRFPMNSTETDADAELSPVDNWLERFLYINGSGQLEPAVTIPDQPLTQSIIAALLKPQSEEEDAAAVVPVNYFEAYGTLERYGAVGDGSTDDTTAWRNALKVGGYVRGKPGKTYRITGAGYLTASDTVIDLRGCTINQVTAATSWLIIGRTVSSSTFVKTDNILVLGGSASGSVVGAGDPAYGISVLQPADNPFVNGNGCSNLEVSGLRSSGFTGALIASGANNVNVHDCSLGGMIYHLHLGAGGYGCLFQTCFDIRIHDNRFKATSTDRHAVYVSTYSDVSYPTDNTNVCKGVVISDNLMDWVGTAGVTGFEASIEVRAAEAIAITGNSIYGGYGGIDYDTVNGNGTGVVIANNVLRGIKSKPAGSQRQAIGVFRSGNSFTASDVVIEGNSIQFDDTNVNGIAVDHASNVTVSGNVINFTNGLDGIIFSHVDNVRVGGNTISSGNGSSAVAFAGTCSDITIGQGTHKGTFGATYRYYSGVALTDIKFDTPRTVTVSWASGTPTIVDPEGIALSAASDAEGFTLTFQDWVLDLTLANLAFSSSSSNVCAMYRRAVASKTLTIGVKDFAAAALPAASNDYSIAITLRS